MSEEVYIDTIAYMEKQGNGGGFAFIEEYEYA